MTMALTKGVRRGRGARGEGVSAEGDGPREAGGHECSGKPGESEG